MSECPDRASAALTRAIACNSPPRFGQRCRAAELAWHFARAALVVAVAVTLASLMVAPRVMRIYSESKSDIANATVKKYAYEAYPSWRAQHPDRTCPEHLEDLNEYMNNKDIIDPWGVPYLASCNARGHLLVWSAGEDCRFKTGDDIRSDE